MCFPVSSNLPKCENNFVQCIFFIWMSYRLSPTPPLSELFDVMKSQWLRMSRFAYTTLLNVPVLLYVIIDGIFLQTHTARF